MPQADHAARIRECIAAVPERPDQVEDWVAEFFEPDADYYPVRKWPEARPCHGHEEITRFMAGMRESWERLRMEALSVIAIDDVRGFAHIRMSTQGRGSGVGLDGDLFQCSWIRAGRYIRVEDHLTRQGAARSLGISIGELEPVRP